MMSALTSMVSFTIVTMLSIFVQGNSSFFQAFMSDISSMTLLALTNNTFMAFWIFLHDQIMSRFAAFPLTWWKSSFGVNDDSKLNQIITSFLCILWSWEQIYNLLISLGYTYILGTQERLLPAYHDLTRKPQSRFFPCRLATLRTTAYCASAWAGSPFHHNATQSDNLASAILSQMSSYSSCNFIFKKFSSWSSIGWLLWIVHRCLSFAGSVQEVRAHLLGWLQLKWDVEVGLGHGTPRHDLPVSRISQ